MIREEYIFWKNKFDQFDNLPDGAWWAACQSEIGSYEKFLDWLETGKNYLKKRR